MMIELLFKLTADDGSLRDVSVRIHEPTRNSPEKKWPWVVPVEVEGRVYNTPGVDPLDGIENAAQHAADLLRALYGDALEPHMDPRS